MRLSPILRLALSPALSVTKRMDRARTDEILVKCTSVVSGYVVDRIRPKIEPQLEFMSWDPLVQREVLYRETGKVLTVRQPKQRNERIENYPCFFKYPVARETVHTPLFYPNQVERKRWTKPYEMVEKW